jgi:hypothetical protein
VDVTLHAFYTLKFHSGERSVSHFDCYTSMDLATIFVTVLKKRTPSPITVVLGYESLSPPSSVVVVT